MYRYRISYFLLFLKLYMGFVNNFASKFNIIMGKLEMLCRISISESSLKKSRLILQCMIGR